MSQEKKHVVVIGSGIGGSSIAALLSHRGYKVTVLEKLGFIGGRCCSRERDGFILDLGVHTFSQSGAGPLGEVLRQCDKSDSLVEWSFTRDPTQKLNYLGKVIEYPKGISDLGVDPDNFMKIMGIIVGMPWEETRKFDHMGVKEWLDQYTDDQVIHNIFAYISELYFIVTYWRASAGEFIRSMQVQAKKRASGYPVGGCRVIPEKYLEVVKENNGVVKTSSEVKRIIINDGIATGVELSNGEIIDADIVISNIDSGLTMLNLIGESYFAKEYIDQIKNLEYTPGAYLLKFALNKKITDEKFLMQISHPNAVEYLTMIENGEIPEKVNLMVPVISNLDPSTAPEGKQLIIAGTFPAIKPDWDAWKTSVLNTVKDLFPDIEEHAMFIEASHPGEVDKLMGEGGGVIGMSQSIDQVGEKRLKQETPIPNVYLVGGEAGGWGIGTELAANSALELNQMIK